MRSILPFVLSFSLAGCIVYDEELVWDDGTPVEAPDRQDPQDPATPDDDPEPAPDPVEDFALTPDTAVPGETVIVFVEAVDPVLGDVTDARFFGPSGIEVTATASNGLSTYVVTIEIPEDASSGFNDLLLERESGEAVYLENVFRVD